MYHPWGSLAEDAGATAPKTPTRPIGIDGLSPHSDDIVVGHRSQTASPCSPIGTDSSGSLFLASPPQHILGLFSPKSSSLIRSLAISPSQSPSPTEDHQTPRRSPRPGMEEDADFSLPPASSNAISEHEEFLLGMGGMDDLDADELHTSGRTGAYGSPRTAGTAMPLPIGTPAISSPRSTFLSPDVSLRASPRTRSPSSPVPPSGSQSLLSTSSPILASASPQQSNLSTSAPGAGASNGSGEHPNGEHPSRTLFVRNINSSIDDDELRGMFERFGSIRSMYTQCKHRGFVMISYYDIRDAKNALKSLQNTILRRRKLDIHFSIPKDNPSEKDQNQGTLVVFNLDPSITNEDLSSIFGAFGEIKEIRETPNKKHHKFIEFYDVRHADQAMRALNKTEVRSKKIKIEHSRPGGLRKSVVSQPTPTTGALSPGVPVPQQPQPLRQQAGLLGGVEDFAAFAYQSVSPQAAYVPGGSGRFESPPFTNNWLSPAATAPGKTAMVGSCPSGYGQHLAQSYPPQEATAFTRPSPQFSSPFMASGYGSPIYSERSMDQRTSAVMGVAWGMQSMEISPSMPMMMPGSGRPLQQGLSGQPRSLPADAHEGMRLQQKPAGKQRQGRASRGQHNEQFVLNLERVLRGVDTRTTLMIKNIPNKYTQKMLLSTINHNHQGHYDFFYLPIDFKNKCNVGYAFINFTSTTHIPGFYERLHNTKWSKFNSEKVCKITYARIQGKDALVDHFRNSTLLSEDKKCRPIIFHSEGPQAGQQAAFPLPSGGRREHRRDEKQKRK